MEIKVYTFVEVNKKSDVVIRYLKEEDGNDDYKLPPTDRKAIFYAKLYKLALCLGYGLRRLRHLTSASC